MSTTFYASPDWARDQKKNRIQVPLADLWPVGSGDGKDVLENGHHPILAIGPETAADGRPRQPVGVVVSYNSDSAQVVMDICQGKLVKAYLTNITGYSGGDANAWESSINFGRVCYVDGSDDLPAGVTLSLSAADDAGVANPMAGWVWHDPDNLDDTGIGGGNSAVLPLSVSGAATVTSTVTIMLAGNGSY